MKLPNFEKAYIPPAKITHYLLNLEHPEGGPKARFLQRYGFTTENPTGLEQALLRHGSAHEVISEEPTVDGIKYRIRGPLESPDGRNPVVLTVWRIPLGENNPRFVTLVPRR